MMKNMSIWKMEKMDMNGNNYITIKCDKEMDEIDVTGFLLQKYVKGSTYDKETKIWSVPQDVYDEIKRS